MKIKIYNLEIQHNIIRNLTNTRQIQMKYNEKEINLYILVRCNHFRPKAQEEIGQEVNLNTSGAIKQTKK